MPPVSGDFLAPKGEIEGGLFPSESPSTLAARIDEYIAQATAAVDALDPALDPADVDAAIAAFVYVRLYDAILIRLANTPNTSIADEGSVAITGSQIAIFQNNRDRHQLAYEAILEGAEVPPLESGTPSTTRAPVIFGF